MRIVGREAEQAVLTACLKSKKPEFVAVYGRRRVGKTYLVRQFFNDNFCFHLTGSSKAGKQEQLRYFDAALKAKGVIPQTPTATWQEAFLRLEQHLEHTKFREVGKRVVFLDELAWLDTHKSGFLAALEHFWNHWGSAQTDLVLIVCGSAASWIINRLLKDRGGLHNRVTRRMRLEPFTLAECSAFFLDKGIDYDKQSVAELYMAFGGIPYYLETVERGLSVAQNIDKACFAQNAPLVPEFEEVYQSLFKAADKHMLVVRALAGKRKGMTREQIIQSTGIGSGGGLTKILAELEQSAFIQSFDDFTQNNLKLYHLVDFFSLFYLTFMDGRDRKEPHFWTGSRQKGPYNNWIGYTFELLCLTHLEGIRSALGISGVNGIVSCWLDPSPGSKLQADLLIDRDDNIIDICEMKYHQGPFAIDKPYRDKLLKRKQAFINATNTKKTIHTVFITRDGLKENSYSHIAEAALELADLWGRVRA